eukprot:1068310-Rhodomonas_salina.6
MVMCVARMTSGESANGVPRHMRVEMLAYLLTGKYILSTRTSPLMRRESWHQPTLRQHPTWQRKARTQQREPNS